MTYKLFMFKEDGVIPNNPSLPAIVYPGVFKDHPLEMQAIFHVNNWRNIWVGGVFDYHHFHSNAHEVLGVLAGSAKLQLGGEQGKPVDVKVGDVLVLPAGTGHKKLSSSPDFEVVGAYPNGDSYNLRTGKPEERPQVLREIQEVALPTTDPVYGNLGQVIESWK